MDTSIKPTGPQEKREIAGYRCTADGKHWAEFPEKRCKYCLPVYADEKGA